MNQFFEEVLVYAAVAERTGTRVERAAVRRSPGVCKSLTDLARKVRASGDGYFYLPVDVWPADTERIELQKPWVVISSLER